MSRATSRIVAEVVKGHTAITSLQHASRSRLYQFAASKVKESGGRLKNGDRKVTEVTVGVNASLNLGSVQEQKLCNRTQASKEVNAKVEKGGLFVHAPLSITPSSTGQFTQRRNIELEAGASTIVVNLMNARNVQYDPEWNPAIGYDTSTKISSSFDEPGFEPLPFLESGMFDEMQAGRDSTGYASITLVGPRTAQVVDRVRVVQRKLAAKEYHSDTSHNMQMPSPLQLIGEVEMSINEHPTQDHGVAVVARIKSEHAEELTRILHQCLLPLQSDLGHAPYSKQAGSTATTTILKADSKQNQFEDIHFKQQLWLQRSVC